MKERRMSGGKGEIETEEKVMHERRKLEERKDSR